MDDFAKRFDGKADVYDRSRPTYPAALFDWLHDGPPAFARAGAIMEAGAGTGLFTRDLLLRGGRVFAVEPGADMLRRMNEGLGGFPGFVGVGRPAEATGLPNGSVDRVVAAQAFHWFNASAFARECRRVLRPGPEAGVALVWNHRVESDPFVRDWDALNRAHCPAYPGFSGGSTGEEARGRIAAFYQGGRFVEQTFANDARLREEAFVERALSGSYAPRPGEGGYDGYIADLRGLFRRHAGSAAGAVAVPQRTVAYWGEAS